MGKRKSTPRKRKPDTAKRRNIKVTREYKIQNKTFNINIKTMKEIRRLQSSVENCIPRLPFSKLIREILMEFGSNEHRIQIEALKALQEAAELYLTHLFEDANRCAFHARRVTLFPRDMALVLQIRGNQDPGRP